MSFATKTDYVGIATTGLELRSNAQNASNQTLEINGSDGSVLGTEVFGHIKAPSCDYAITDDVTLDDLELGKVHGSGTVPFALQSLTISTSAGGEPTVSATAVQLQTGATAAVCTYAIPEVSLSPARHALDFGAFTFTESATLALQDCTFVAECGLDPTTVNGDPRAADAVGGKVTVSATFWTTSDTTPPSVTAATGWTQTSDWNCTGADSSMFVWTATFVKYLAVSE